MKRGITIILFCLPVLLANAQTGYTAFYQFGLSPTPQLKTSHGFGIDLFHGIKKSGYSLGLSYSMGVYGYQQEPLEFTTSDGRLLKTTMSVTNSMHYAGIYQRYTFGQFSTVFFPYADVRLGWNFLRTNLTINDPEDSTNCKPLEETVLYSDNNWSVYAGAGVDVKLTGLFNDSKRGEANRGLFLSFGFGYTLGGTVSYMSVNGGEIANGPHHGTAHTNTEGNTTKTPYYSAFINTQTQVVHEHHTGYVYTSPIRMFQVRGGISVKF